MKITPEILNVLSELFGFTNFAEIFPQFDDQETTLSIVSNVDYIIPSQKAGESLEVKNEIIYSQYLEYADKLKLAIPEVEIDTSFNALISLNFFYKIKIKDIVLIKGCDFLKGNWVHFINDLDLTEPRELTEAEKWELSVYSASQTQEFPDKKWFRCTFSLIKGDADALAQQGLLEKYQYTAVTMSTVIISQTAKTAFVDWTRRVFDLCNPYVYFEFNTFFGNPFREIISFPLLHRLDALENPSQEPDAKLVIYENNLQLSIDEKIKIEPLKQAILKDQGEISNIDGTFDVEKLRKLEIFPKADDLEIEGAINLLSSEFFKTSYIIYKPMFGFENQEEEMSYWKIREELYFKYSQPEKPIEETKEDFENYDVPF